MGGCCSTKGVLDGVGATYTMDGGPDAVAAASAVARAAASKAGNSGGKLLRPRELTKQQTREQKKKKRARALVAAKLKKQEAQARLKANGSSNRWSLSPAQSSSSPSNSHHMSAPAWVTTQASGQLFDDEHVSDSPSTPSSSKRASLSMRLADALPRQKKRRSQEVAAASSSTHQQQQQQQQHAAVSEAATAAAAAAAALLPVPCAVTRHSGVTDNSDESTKSSRSFQGDSSMLPSGVQTFAFAAESSFISYHSDNDDDDYDIGNEQRRDG
jgi:hypothetical protein